MMTQNIINYWSYKETQRHNIAMEQYNVNALAETKRHNLVTEGVAKENVAVAWANNQLGWSQLAETTRHNKESETISWANHYENVRHNKANESIGWGNISLGYAQLSESTRHNKASESNQLLQLGVQMQQATTASGRLILDARNSRWQQDVAQQNADSQTSRVDTYQKSEFSKIAFGIYDRFTKGIDTVAKLLT